MTSYDNRWPGEKEFAPVFDELNRRKAVVFFHPHAGLPEPDQQRPDSAIEFLFDTVRARSRASLIAERSRAAPTRASSSATTAARCRC